MAATGGLRGWNRHIDNCFGVAGTFATGLEMVRTSTSGNSRITIAVPSSTMVGWDSALTAPAPQCALKK
jgi:hypothetical protein